MQRALDAAHEAIVHFPNDDSSNRAIDFETFIQPYAESGPFGAQVRKALAADPGNMVGSLMQAYAQPGILAGLALAWLTFGRGAEIAPHLSPLGLRALLRTIGNYDADEASATIDHAMQLARRLTTSSQPFTGHIDDPDPGTEVLRRVALDTSPDMDDGREMRRVIDAMLRAPLDGAPLTTTTAITFAITSAAVTHAMLIGGATLHEMMTGGRR